MTIKKLILASLLLSMTLLVAVSAYAAPLYFPHIATSNPWQTEIAIINTSSELTVTGTLRALSNGGQLVETKDVTLPARGRRQIIVADEFTNHTNIGYIIFDKDSDTVQGYTKFYQEGVYRAAIPAIKEVNTSDIYVPHIASSADWWTEISLVNTTLAPKQLTITFSNGQSRQFTLNANEHRAFDIVSLFNNQPQPDIQSAVISNASGVIGLELFGSIGGGNQLDGILLTDDTASTIYYPHVASNDTWWTGIVAYNPSDSAGTITITPYNAQGTPLSPATLPIAGKEKYVGVVSNLGLPAQTEWFKIASTQPLTGFELFATYDGKQLAAYAGSAAKTGVFAKIEKNGWTGISFVNTEAGVASVTLTAYNDSGTVVATQVLPVGGYAKVVNIAENIFTQDISGATYIAYSSDRNVVGFQLNGTSDGMMLDALPGLAGDGTGGGGSQPVFTGFDLQFKQGDYWLYEWKDVYTHRGLVRNFFTGLYSWDTTTRTGTVRISLGQPRTIMDITFYQITTELTGDAKYVTFPWLYVASYNNQIYGYRDDGVYLIFDAQNGTWKGGSFFYGASKTDWFGPAGTFSISISNTEPGTYWVSWPDKGTSIAGYRLSELEYYRPGVGPVKQKIIVRSETSHSEETLILIESSRGI
ncbi:MAG: hypothetical protein EHM85_05835 [Desulfobacteraceae bacterium]|nr:MAG: hypothetical protein EHM85_05835 [Desulfobacteraceae bacterium]